MASTQFLQKAYLAYFGRPVDTQGGLTYASASEAAVTNAFSGSAESQSLYGASFGTAQVNAIYQMLFGRDAEPAGLTYWVDRVNSGVVSPAGAALAILEGAQNADATAITNKIATSALFTAGLDTTAEILGYSGNTAAATARDFLKTVTTTAATQAAVDAAIVSTVAAGSTGTGSSFTLTTGIDTVTGTSGNDTVLGDFTTTSTLNAGDQINGGNGTDTLKMYGTYDSTKMPVTVTSIEVLDLVTAANAALDLSGWTKATTGIAKVVVENAAAINGATITTTAGQALSLATGATGAATAGTVTWAGSATDTSLDLTLNGYQGGTGVTPVALTITGAAATTQNIASTGAANKATTLTLGAVTNKVVVTGDKNLTVSTDLVSSAGATVLKTVDASAATGNVAITLAAASNAAFAFTGGSGNDTIKFADDGLAALTAGTQLDGGAGTADKIGILDTTISATEYARINAAKNFEVLGLNDAVTVAADSLTSIKQFSLDANAAQSMTNMATGSVVSVTAAHAAAITTGGAVGVNDLTFNVGTATTTGITLGGTVTIGQTTVALTSNGTNAAANTITTLDTAENSVITITGSNDLTIGGISSPTTTGSKLDASAATGKINITANQVAYAAGSAKGDILIGGTAADTLKAGLNSTKLTGNAGNDNFNVSTAVTGATSAANITSITDFTKGDKITFAATAGAFTTTKVDLSAVTSEQAAIDALVAGSNSDVKWGNYNGFTYVVDDVNTGATMAADDHVVKLTGTLDLSTSTFASNALTFA